MTGNIMGNASFKMGSLFANTSAPTANDAQIQMIALSDLTEFSASIDGKAVAHPFRVMEDEAMCRLAESVKNEGVLTPLLVRKSASGKGYQIVSGHRRHHAAIMAGLTEVPCVIRELSDDEATILMVDANLQRDEILPSERAFAFRGRLEAMNHQGKRQTDESGLKSASGRSVDDLAAMLNMSRATVQRFVRLTYLTKELLKAVDDGLLSVNAAYHLSYLSPAGMDNVFAVCSELKQYPSIEQAQKVKESATSGNIGKLDIRAIMKGQEKAKKTPELKVTIQGDTLRTFFPNMSAADIQKKVMDILTEWYQTQQNG